MRGIMRGYDTLAEFRQWGLMTMLLKRTVLITGVGSPGAPGIIRSLRLAHNWDIRLIGVDANRRAAGSFLLDHFYVVPEAQDPKFIPTMLEICKNESVHVILPMVTAELIPFAKHASAFQELGCVVSVSSESVLETAIHKNKLFEVLAGQGFSIPQFKLVNTSKALMNAIEELGYPHTPVCFKPAQGDGSRGFHVLDAKQNRIENFFLAKPDATLVSLTELSEVLHHQSALPELLVMEYLPGSEYSVDLLVNHGEVLVTVPRRREKIVGGITTQGTIVEEHDVLNYASHVAKVMKLHGNIGIQVRRSQTGIVKLLEVNPRLQGTVVHCTGAGVNMPLLAVKLALGMPVEQSELQIRWGTRLYRYWNEVFYHEEGAKGGAAYTLDMLKEPNL